jgi:SAM-dependent methyltransferase
MIAETFFFAVIPQSMTRKSFQDLSGDLRECRANRAQGMVRVTVLHANLMAVRARRSFSSLCAKSSRCSAAQVARDRALRHLRGLLRTQCAPFTAPAREALLIGPCPQSIAQASNYPARSALPRFLLLSAGDTHRLPPRFLLLSDRAMSQPGYACRVTAGEAAGNGAVGTSYNDYETFAAAYARASETSPYNALYERPAILALAGDVRGRRVLDAGCGSGAHAAELIARGAAVTGMDLSAGLVEIARERLGPGVPVHVGDLSQPLPFGESAFDLVLSSLVMHYIGDWEPTLREFHRVLAPGGRLVFSTHHPFMDMRISGSDDYFGRYQFTEEWERDGRVMTMRFWHRPLRAMLAALRGSGFSVEEIAEPDPATKLATTYPDAYRHLSREAQFLFFSLARA